VITTSLRSAIIGCGSIGPTHAGALRQIEGVELVAVADVLPERAQERARKFNVVNAYSSALITPESSRRSVATILAIQESARRGKVVRV